MPFKKKKKKEKKIQNKFFLKQFLRKYEARGLQFTEIGLHSKPLPVNFTKILVSGAVMFKKTSD